MGPVCLAITSQVGMETPSSRITGGVEYDSFEQARTAALRSLGEMALYSLPRSPKERILKVQVKDGGDNPLVELRLAFESIDGT